MKGGLAGFNSSCFPRTAFPALKSKPIAGRPAGLKSWEESQPHLALRGRHCAGYGSSQVGRALHDRLGISRQRGGQIRNRLVRIFEIKGAS